MNMYLNVYIEKIYFRTVYFSYYNKNLYLFCTIKKKKKYNILLNVLPIMPEA